MALDRDAAARAVSRLARRLGGSLEQAAAGIIDVANVTMARAIRQVSLFRGYDPGDFALCAFGGAGGLHAAELAAAAGISAVLVPPAPGVLSAWGLLAGDVVVARSATVLQEGTAMSGGRLEGVFLPLEKECRKVLAEELGAGPVSLAVEMERTVEARYQGQSHELAVPAAGWRESFHDLHEKRFGFARREDGLTLVNARVIARARVPLPPPASARAEGALRGDGDPVRIWHEGRWCEGRLRSRGALADAATMSGPAVIADEGSTVWIPPGRCARVLEDGSLLVSSVPETSS